MLQILLFASQDYRCGSGEPVPTGAIPLKYEQLRRRIRKSGGDIEQEALRGQVNALLRLRETLLSTIRAAVEGFDHQLISLESAPLTPEPVAGEGDDQGAGAQIAGAENGLPNLRLDAANGASSR